MLADFIVSSISEPSKIKNQVRGETYAVFFGCFEKVKCEFCGKEEALPFVCNYCGGAYCGEHRLPETHQCKGDLSQRRTIVVPPQTQETRTDMGGTFTGQTTPASNKVFSTVEIRDILIAWLGLGVAFSISFIGPLEGGFAAVSDPLGVALIFAISLLTIGSGFVLHELSHKFVAQRYGNWAEFRMWPFGLVLALGTSILGFIFAAPGATYISGANISEAENGKISLAGPLTNVGVALIFFSLFWLGTDLWGFVGSLGFRLNLFLAIFNLLPFGPLDGAKVFAWNKVLWAVVFAGLTLVYYFFVLA